MKKLGKIIKLTGTHYVVVKEDKIKEGVNQWYFERAIREPYNSGGAQYSSPQLIITHSNVPLEYKYSSAKKGYSEVELVFDTIKPMSTEEFEQAIDGHVARMAYENINKCGFNNTSYAGHAMQSYINGFKAHQELTKDKRFTFKDIKTAFSKGIEYASKPYPENVQFEIEYENSLLPMEWDIEIDENNKMTII